MKNIFQFLKNILPLALPIFLAWISDGRISGNAVSQLIGAELIAIAIIWITLSALKRDSKSASWLRTLTYGAALLRLFAGVLWFTLLPAAGYDTEVQQAGYIMEDAYQRDLAAWELADSDQPLSKAFDGSYRVADQYGGLLFFSAWAYRLLSPVAAQHYPLLIVVLASAASALVVPIGWAFTRRLFGERSAVWAAWLLALFPEAVLLGSSQMREAWIMPLVAAAFYGLVVFAQEDHTDQFRGILWMLAAFLLLLPLSPPFAVILIGLLGVLSVSILRWRFLHDWRFWALLIGMALLVLAVVWMAWPQIAPGLNGEAADNPLEMAWNWLSQVAHWQAYLSERSSGWLQKIFSETPDWFNLPFLIGYGVTRPLLPAQIVASTIPFWWWVGVWRAIGWTAMLALLLYAPVQLLTHKEHRGVRIGLVLVVWFGILYASFWGGGDQWDNPRYRVAFIVLQAALAASVVVLQLRKPHPAMRRTLLLGGSVIFWLGLWYLQRYTGFGSGWMINNPFLFLTAGLVTGALLIAWDVIRKDPNRSSHQ